MKRNISALLSLCLLAGSAWAQESAQTDKVTVNGSIQSDILIPQDDKAIGAEKDGDWAKTNTYVDLSAAYKHLGAGLRVEYLDHPLPGFEADMKGWGLMHAYLRLKYDKIDVTAGSFYEQFGSGFILRTYEDRNLGVDNALIGGRVIVKPTQGITIKALSGKQRRYWDVNKSLVSGADLELNTETWLKALANHGTRLTLGFSWVNKYEKNHNDISTIVTEDGEPHRKILNVPEFVNAFDVRALLNAGNFSVLGEYAWKTQDPIFDKNYPYIYRKGSVAMLSTSYSKSGLSVLLQAKRSDNMSFRSSRTISGTSSFINHLPAFTLDHTYALAAIYPYATQPNGEWAYQAEVGYRFKRGTALGGKYGTDIKVNFSHVHAIERNRLADANSTMGSDGYSSAFWKWGNEKYYQDIDVQISKRITRSFWLNLMYMNQYYNKSVVEGEGGMIHSNIFVADAKYRFNKTFTLRGEVQYLSTKDDDGDWIYGLLELSVLPHFMITVADMYNSGVTNTHYYQGYVTYNHGAHRLQVGYGRTRAGFNCAGGVCRYVPASKGFTVSYNFNF
ncbi:MAG: DUF6029 family protein [bacterium]|nr:DUF6029 family protein [bacterium]MDD6026419.1 DUF6029 family protein [bacterium]